MKRAIFSFCVLFLLFNCLMYSQIKNLKSMEGTWIGQWVNSYYQSTGNITAVFTVDVVNMKAHGEWNVGGNILGQPRGPFSTDITFNSTSFSANFNSSIWGDITGTGTLATGAYSGSAANCPNPNAQNITAQGTLNSLTITGTFNFVWTGIPISGTFQVTKQNPIAIPTNLTLSENPPGTINIGWQDNAANETGYRIERKTLPSGSWSQVGTVGANAHTFIDNNNITAGTQYFYRVAGYNTNTESEYCSEMNITTTVTAVNDYTFIPSEYTLLQNYPNPFNPNTIIRYNLPKESRVIVSIYSILGEIASILVNEIQNQGNYELFFDASKYSSGVYLVKMIAQSIESGRIFVDAKKMLLMK